MKKIISWLLTVAVAISCVLVSAEAAPVENTKVSGTVYISGRFTYYYDDGYFTNSSLVYNPSLSTMSLCLACSGTASSPTPGYEQKSYYAKKLLGEIGFKEFATNADFTVAPDTDTMGVAVANKVITDGTRNYTLIAVVPRSMNYGGEWASNFTLGKSGEAQGFSEAASIVEAYLEEYVTTYGDGFEDNIKLWIVGYSRGAAVANLTAAHITAAGKIGSLTVSKENIYGYTFETPMGANTDVMSREDAKNNFLNIHNIINPNDLVTTVAPSYYGFMRYGVDEYVIPATQNASNKKMYEGVVSFLEQYSPSFLGTDDNGNKILAYDSFEGKKLTDDKSVVLSENGAISRLINKDYEGAKELLLVETDRTFTEFIQDLLFEMAVGIETRENYANDIEELLRIYLNEKNGVDGEPERVDVAVGIFLRLLDENKFEIAKSVLLNKKTIEDVCVEYMTMAIAQSGLDEETYAGVPEKIVALAPYVSKIITRAIEYNGAADLFSVFDNMDVLTLAHYPEMCLAWMQVQDKNYHRNADEIYNKYAFVDASSSNKLQGTVRGYNAYKIGDTVTVFAEAKQGYTFVGWKKDGKYISGKAEYSFVLAEDTALVAEFIATSDYACKHIDTYTVGGFGATCESVGFTGDYYCERCNTFVAYGNAIGKTKHTYNAENWIKEQPATTEVNGIKGHYYCESCKKNYDREGKVIVDLTIPKLYSCTYTVAVSASEGTYDVIINQKTAGLKIEKTANGFALYDVDLGAYLALNGDGDIAFDNSQYEWEYDGGFYGRVTKLGSGLLASVFPKLYSKTYSYYISSTGGDYTATESKTSVVINKTVTSDKHTYRYEIVDENQHKAICTCCNFNKTENHSFDANGRCACGRYNTEYATVTAVNGVKSSKTTTTGILFWKKRVVTYYLSITPVSRVSVTEVAYSTDGVNFTTGNMYSSSSQINYLVVRVSDANGTVTEWTYNGSDFVKK